MRGIDLALAVAVKIGQPGREWVAPLKLSFLRRYFVGLCLKQQSL